MTSFIALSTRLYAALLPLYPLDLRRDFGAEMTSVFAEDLTDAWQNKGAPGLIRVLSSAALEFVRIAVPGLMQIPAIAVPLLSFLFGAAIISSELLLTPNRDDFALGAALGAALINALTSFASVRIGESGVPHSLELPKCSKSAISPNVSSAPLLWTV
jgi:hypothetical protein